MTINCGLSKRSSLGLCLASGLGAIALCFVALAGCQNNRNESHTAPEAAPKSSIAVSTSSDEIVVRTPAAEFHLSSAGALTAKLLSANAVSLDASPTGPAQVVTVAKKDHAGVELISAGAKVTDISGKLGSLGKQITVTGTIPGTDLRETLTLEVYDNFPGLALLSAQLQNSGQGDVALDRVVLQRHTFGAPQGSTKSSLPLWTFEGSSLDWGKDEILPVPAKFSQENPFGAPVKVKGDLGHVGGGIPVVAFWSSTVGEAIGHIETVPFVLSVPVQTTQDGQVSAAVSIPAGATLKPGEVFSTPRTFLSIYSGDFYEPLRTWSDAVEKEGLTKPANNDENYAVAWCGWGYEFGVTPKQMLDTIPKLKELGIHWATLDDGWFNNYGDWRPHEPVFAGTAMQDMVKQFHDQGFKVQLWWLPLAVEDGKFGYGGRRFVTSEVLKQHPDWLVLDETGKPARMARNLATLCPAALL